jgi:signal peptidase I
MGQNQPRIGNPHDALKEPAVQQIASFVGFFIYLLVLKSFFLPLFVIPTGSMAETLYGAHAIHTCPNCGFEYPVGMPLSGPIIRCPNCHWQEAVEPLPYHSPLTQVASVAGQPLHARGGDRIMVHGWTYDLGRSLGPHRWDVVVFKVPSDMTTNYIKRLIGKPGETIEIIDGDIYVAPPGGELAIARKPRDVQDSLWFPYFNNDFQPLRPSQEGQYHPRWTAVGNGRAWQGLDTRGPRFEGGPGEEGRIRFVTEPAPALSPGLITDVYGYDLPYVTDRRGHVQRPEPHVVSDVRLSCSVDFDSAAPPDTFVELSTTKNGDTFFGRIYRDGRLTLERVGEKRGTRELWGSGQIKPPAGPVVFALSSVDYVVSLEVNGAVKLRSTPEQYDADVRQARAHSKNPVSPQLLITAGGGQVSLDHLLIERDVYYTSELSGGIVGYGTQGHPISLGPNDYFMLGDNSPCSQDSRYSFVSSTKYEHLLESDVNPDYQLGTVPGDQLIGPAFLVYWPGMAELLPDRYMTGALRFLNILPTPGRVRWIR